jgi:nitroimidazol reductase NimA-like FMN-containing flavoprotein (pyridoxamine 5'-phosphate oxidase superfamily)
MTYVIKNDTLKIYFVRSIETQKLALLSTIGAVTCVTLPSP